ncbi:MAG: inorganic diphosphatase [Nanoarchaeota archaeon]|nr:inorganic diphosphatase [Nanoarchaeota archaeon]MBU1030420.1 inorganic diphosphatase [Nanoarchaeota archaeon]MBU1850015.1 inorganic diphosphatase [Nanoarchaeota archaeon]
MKKETLKVIVEIPKGSRNKYEMNKKTGRIRFDRMLFSAMHYPCDYGYIEDTWGLDNDPLDALILVWEPTFPGCEIEVKPIGFFDMADEKGQDEKILCIPVNDPLWNHLSDFKDVNPHLLKEIENFFAMYKDLEKRKSTQVKGWKSKKKALKVIREAQERYKNIKK